MIFSLDLRRARKGDCLLLHFGSKADPGLVMIDGGPKSVYAPHLKPRLQQIRSARGLAKEQPLLVDMLMVSHVDDDHIQGILDLTREMIEAQDAGRPLPLKILSFWHNSFDDIIGNPSDELQAVLAAWSGAASRSQGGPEDAADHLDECPKTPLEEEVIRDSLKVLASIEQGHRLRDDAEKLGFPLNPEFEGKLIIASGKAAWIEIAQGLKFAVVGPMKPELERLQKKHDAWLRKQRRKITSASAALAAYVDRSIPNLSSIVLLAEFDGKRMLLTGDARGDKILEGLERAGLMKKGGGLTVDLLKVPHHGSANNLEADFFKRITADHYVFSGDGEHGNPERAALEMLFEARGDQAFTVHFTYPVEEIDVERERDWKKERNKERRRRDKVPPEKSDKFRVRPVWSHEAHSLAAFFAGRGVPNPEQTIACVQEGKSHVIDLLDPIEL